MVVNVMCDPALHTSPVLLVRQKSAFQPPVLLVTTLCISIAHHVVISAVYD